MSGSSWFLTRTTAIDRVLTSDGASTNSKRLCVAQFNKGAGLPMTATVMLVQLIKSLKKS